MCKLEWFQSHTLIAHYIFDMINTCTFFTYMLNSNAVLLRVCLPAICGTKIGSVTALTASVIEGWTIRGWTDGVLTVMGFKVDVTGTLEGGSGVSVDEAQTALLSAKFQWYAQIQSQQHSLTLPCMTDVIHSLWWQIQIAETICFRLVHLLGLSEETATGLLAQ